MEGHNYRVVVIWTKVARDSPLDEYVRSEPCSLCGQSIPSRWTSKSIGPEEGLGQGEEQQVTRYDARKGDKNFGHKTKNNLSSEQSYISISFHIVSVY